MIEHEYIEEGEYEIKIYGASAGYSLGGSVSEQTVDPACCITDVEFAWDLTTTRDYAFKGAQIKELKLTPYMTRIARAAFAACKQLQTITLPNSIFELGSQAFEGCTGLTGTIVIPRTVNTVGSGVFQNCTSLEYLIFDGDDANPGALRVIGNNFANNTSIKELIIPKFITQLNATAFGNCNSLTKVVLLNPDLIMEDRVFNATARLNSAGPIDWNLGAGKNNNYDIEYA